MEKKKKTWTEPKLTVLVRRNPEEGILHNCKTSSGVSGAGFCAGECYVNAACNWCDELGTT